MAKPTNYCSSCGQPVQRKDTFCQSCGRQLTTRDPPQRTRKGTRTAYTKLWPTFAASPLLSLAMYFFASFAIGFLYGYGSLTYGEYDALLGVSSGLYMLLLFLSAPMAVYGYYRDKQQLGQHYGWQPTGFYYVLVIPGLNILVALVYLLHRFVRMRSQQSQPQPQSI